MPARSGPRLFVDQLHARLFQPLQCSFDIGDAIGDVVKTRPAFIEKFLHGGIGRGRLQKLDARRTSAYEGDIDFLGFDALDRGTDSVRQEFEKWQRGGDGRHRNRDMIYFHRGSDFAT